MKTYLPIFISICSFLNCFSQNLAIGKYNTNNESHNNPFHYEEIILHNDGRFDYFLEMDEFSRVKKNGNWVIKKDTLILNEDNPPYKQLMTVKETYDKKISSGFLKFDVYEAGERFFIYHISVTHSDTTIKIRDLEKPALIHLQHADQFEISNTSYDYPSYKTNNKHANHFLVNIFPWPLFINEKWLIKKGNIWPNGSNGYYAGYYLTLTSQ